MVQTLYLADKETEARERKEVPKVTCELWYGLIPILASLFSLRELGSVLGGMCESTGMGRGVHEVRKDTKVGCTEVCLLRTSALGNATCFIS